MFLIEMSLDTKRSEIKKLEDLAAQREALLKTNEKMLKEDKMRFDAFLKENATLAAEAMKQAELETKAKGDKMAEIKRINAQIIAIKSDLSKAEDRLYNCAQYKKFLDELTPQEWIDEQMAIKRKRQEERRKARRAQAQAEAAAAEAELAERIANESAAQQGGGSGSSASLSGSMGGTSSGAAAAAAAEKGAAASAAAAASGVSGSSSSRGGGGGGGGNQGAGSSSALAASLQRKGKGGDGASRSKVGAGARTEEDEADSSGEELPMYFTNPKQLLDIFTALEEKNLFLIQNSQETEEALEDLKRKFKETKEKKDEEVNQLKAQITRLNGLIAKEESRMALLQSKSKRATDGGGEKGQEVERLTEKVAEVYAACGFDTQGLTILEMLTSIEAKLESLITVVDRMDPKLVHEAERAREKDRRQNMRLEKLELQKRQQEERLQRSLERSKAPVTKRTGKPVMFRSRPLEKKNDEHDKSKATADEEDDIREFFI
jgi:hypothetical protein